MNVGTNIVWVVACIAAAIAVIGAGVTWVFAVRTILISRQVTRTLEEVRRRG